MGIGIDIVEVQRIEQLAEKHESFLARVYTEAEISYCSKKKNRHQHFAARFAAKVSVLKALGVGWARDVKWTDVDYLIVGSDVSGTYSQLYIGSNDSRTLTTYTEFETGLSQNNGLTWIVGSHTVSMVVDLDSTPAVHDEGVEKHSNTGTSALTYTLQGIGASRTLLLLRQLPSTGNRSTMAFRRREDECI